MQKALEHLLQLADGPLVVGVHGGLAEGAAHGGVQRQRRLHDARAQLLHLGAEPLQVAVQEGGKDLGRGSGRAWGQWEAKVSRLQGACRPRPPAVGTGWGPFAAHNCCPPTCISESLEGVSTASVTNRRCRRGSMVKEPAVGFMQATYCVPPMFFWVSFWRS